MSDAAGRVMAASSGPGDRVEIVEVAPRDGFQSIAGPLPTAGKVAVIEALVPAGLPRDEIGSVVSPRAVPQMADMGEIAAAVTGAGGACPSALVRDARGAECAPAAGLRELVRPFSVSEARNRADVRRSVAESVEGLGEVAATGGDPALGLRVDLATASDCACEGAMPEAPVLAAVETVGRLAPGAEIALCDTTGRADPALVRDRCRAAMAAADEGTPSAFYGHDTCGTGVANAFFASEAGVRVIDGAAAGLGGYPFAPGARGNTATDDLVFTFERAGIATGVRLDAPLGAADRIAALRGASVCGHLRAAPRERAVA